MRTRPKPTLARCLALAACVASCAAAHTTTAAPAAEVIPPQQEPISLVLRAHTGQHIDLADHRGKALLVLAFTTDNLASHAMLRNLERVGRRHPDDLAVVAIAGDEGDASVLRTLLDTFQSVEALERVTIALASDELRAGRTVLGEIERVPTLFFVNRAGVIVRRIEALLSEAQVEALIAPALPPRR